MNENEWYDDPRLKLVRRCVDCGRETMTLQHGAIVCNDCGRSYSFDKDGILHAFATGPKSHEPAIYRSRFYRRWLDAWQKEIPDWVIYSKPLYRFFSMASHRQLVRFLPKLTPSELIVDLGCGSGQGFQLLPSGQSIGVDSNLEFLRVLKQRFPGALAIHSDIANTPFLSATVACPVSLHTLEHLYHLDESLAEIRRMLAPGGRFVFGIPTEGGFGWELGRRLVTGPRLRKRYGLDVATVMGIEHLNDAKRVLRFIGWHFAVEKLVYSPFPFLPFLSVNSCITGIASPLPEDSEFNSR